MQVVCVTGNGVLRFLHLEQNEFKSIPFSMGKRYGFHLFCANNISARQKERERERERERGAKQAPYFVCITMNVCESESGLCKCML